jgi:hypothetical protein
MMCKTDMPAIEPGGLVRGSQAHRRRHWSTSTGQCNDSRAYDTDDNGMVDVVDIQRFAAAWGWISPG